MQGFDSGFEAGVDFVMEYARMLDAEAAVAPAEMPREAMCRPKTKIPDDAVMRPLDRNSLA